MFFHGHAFLSYQTKRSASVERNALTGIGRQGRKRQLLIGGGGQLFFKKLRAINLLNACDVTPLCSK